MLKNKKLLTIDDNKEENKNDVRKPAFFTDKKRKEEIDKNTE